MLHQRLTRTKKKEAWPQSFRNWTSDGSLEQKNKLLICFHWFLSGDEARIMFKLMFRYLVIKWTQLSTKKGPMYWLCFETVRKISLQCHLTFDWNWSRLMSTNVHRHQVSITWASFMRTACWGSPWIRSQRGSCSSHGWSSTLTRFWLVSRTSAGSVRPPERLSCAADKKCFDVLIV